MLSYRSSVVVFISLFILFLLPIYFIFNNIYKSSDRAEYLLEFIYKIEPLPKDDNINEYISWLEINDLYFFEKELFKVHELASNDQIPNLSDYNNVIKNLEIIVDEPKKILRIVFEIYELESISPIREIISETIYSRTKEIISRRNNIDFILKSLETKNYACEDMIMNLENIAESFTKDQKKSAVYIELLKSLKECEMSVAENNVLKDRIYEMTYANSNDNIFKNNLYSSVIRKNSYNFLGLNEYNLFALTPIISAFLSFLFTLIIIVISFLWKLKKALD